MWILRLCWVFPPAGVSPDAKTPDGDFPFAFDGVAFDSDAWDPLFDPIELDRFEVHHWLEARMRAGSRRLHAAGGDLRQCCFAVFPLVCCFYSQCKVKVDADRCTIANQDCSYCLRTVCDSCIAARTDTLVVCCDAVCVSHLRENLASTRDLVWTNAGAGAWASLPLTVAPGRSGSCANSESSCSTDATATSSSVGSTSTSADSSGSGSGNGSGGAAGGDVVFAMPRKPPARPTLKRKPLADTGTDLVRWVVCGSAPVWGR